MSIDGTSSDLQIAAGDGPAYTPTASPGTGFASPSPSGYRVSGATAGEYRGAITALDALIAAGDRLVYYVFPEYDAASGAGRTAATETAGFGASAVAVDLVLDGGQRLSTAGLRDQHGVGASAAEQGAAKTVLPDQWNRREIDLTPLAGHRVTTAEAVLVADGNQADIAGWISDLVIEPAPADTRSRPSDYVVTTRGTNSSGQLSRGLNLPLAGVPHGFNFYTPATDASTERWVYSYGRTGAGNRLALQGLSVSHQPSPWMGDRCIVQFLPGSGRPTADRAARALTFGHENESATAHRYDVRCDDGTVVSLAPTSHAMLAEISYPTDDALIVFDQISGEGALTVGTDGSVVTGHTDAGSARSDGAPRMYFRFEIDAPITDRGLVDAPDRDGVCGYVRLDLAAGRTVRLRLATSFISLEQAERNMRLELSADDTVDTVAARAQQEWDDILGMVQVEGATPDQLTTLYSNLYRLYLYPNVAHENTGTAQAPQYRYASPFRPVERPHDDERTGSPVVDGKVYVNNGFWDTYRTTWPAYALFTPERAAELLDGFVQHFRDGGWMARWSSPGYADCMVGTSSDIVIADALAKGVELPDVEGAYDSALKNATVPSAVAEVGRKGLDTGIFRGYIDTDTTEGMSWSLESAVNDFGLTALSEMMLERYPDHPRRAEFASNALYFRSRAASYALLFDPAVDFFHGRNPDGEFRLPAAEFDPRVWGFDYTETNGWGMAFTVPHDGAGLAALYGGTAGLEAKLDEYFTTPETGEQEFKGSYNQVIHEMTEARNVRLGMLGLSNQPAHHVPYMYLFAGAPAKTQSLTREAVSRLFLGSEIGQGYPGDEDNGEMSAWWVFSALGFYPVTVGSPTYAITSPLFTKATVRLATGNTITINAPNNSPENIYIRSLRVNGKDWPSLFLPHDVLAAGATIDVDLADAPTGWGADLTPPPSLTVDDSVPAPLRDLVTPATVQVSAGEAGLAIDDTSQTELSVAGDWWIEHRADAPVTVGVYTVTAAADPATAPTDWVLEGSTDGQDWSVLDERHGETYRWGLQTRPYAVPTPGPWQRYRIRLTHEPAASKTLAQVEFLA